MISLHLSLGFKLDESFSRCFMLSECYNLQFLDGEN